MSKHICNTKSGYHPGMTRKRTRTYVKAARADSEAETRLRIVEALVELHEEVGPRRTTVKAVAERAGVQRLTVYRHFPDENAMFAACSALWAERVPFPDHEAINEHDPHRRARAILLALYRWYRSGESMLENIIADAPHVEAVRKAMRPIRDYLDALVAELEKGWRGASRRRRATLQHAVQFATWQSLAAITGDDAAAADLVMQWCDAAPVMPAAALRATRATRSHRSSRDS